AEPPALSCSGGSATPPERHPGGPCIISSSALSLAPSCRSLLRSLARLAPARRPPPQRSGLPPCGARSARNHQFLQRPRVGGDEPDAVMGDDDGVRVAEAAQPGHVDARFHG